MACPRPEWGASQGLIECATQSWSHHIRDLEYFPDLLGGQVNLTDSENSDECSRKNGHYTVISSKVNITKFTLTRSLLKTSLLQNKLTNKQKKTSLLSFSDQKHRHPLTVLTEDKVRNSICSGQRHEPGFKRSSVSHHLHSCPGRCARYPPSQSLPGLRAAPHGLVELRHSRSSCSCRCRCSSRSADSCMALMCRW